MEEWKLGTEQNQSDWDDCHGCVSAGPARMPSRVLRDIWKAVHHKIDVCSTALNSRPIRRDVCDIETWTGLSKTARTSTFWWSCGHGRWSGHGSPTCRRLKVVRSDGRSKIQVDGWWMDKYNHHVDNVHLADGVLHDDVGSWIEE